jgi:uncharacterized protein (TIGR04141 family)
MAKKTITLHLAKPDVAAFEEVLSETARDRLARASTQIINAPDFADGARLFVFVGDSVIPGWVREIRLHFPLQGQIENSSSAAVLAFRKNERIFAATFAHGWMFLEEENVEGDFGLRVALNALDDKKLKRLERANLGDALRAVSQSPFQRDFSSFGLDDSLDLVRKLSGRTKTDTSADAMSGARSLKITGEYELDDLPEIAEEALEFYDSIAYRDSSFRIIDFVSPVTDRRLADHLDELAVQSIREERDEFELGLPINYEDDSVTYKFSGPRLRGTYPDLLLRNYVEALGPQIVDCNTQTIRDHRIVAVYDDNAPARKWSIRSALVGSLTYAGGRYAINEGEWYRVDEAFKQSIEESFSEAFEEWEGPAPTPLRKIIIDGKNKYQSEASYNSEWAAASRYILLDTHEISIPGIRRSAFEACDLLDIEGKRFIHVKKSSRRSSVLSHFFKQGSNSAQQFRRFPAAWDQLCEVVEARTNAAQALRLREVMADDRSWKVQFVVADSPRANGQFNIPFFSKISLRDEAINLRAMGYEVGLRFIRLQPERIAAQRAAA